MIGRTAAVSGVLLLSLGLGRFVSAGEGKPNIVDLRMGSHWAGPDVGPADLVGKVVLVEIWGS
jgi:hypothetical protein